VGYPCPHRKRGVRFKLDENLSRRAADLICAAGHDAVTVANQGLRGAADETLFEVCRRESRALVTLDRPPGIASDGPTV
jgi:predicted nuclease of predicted toxin-antitoxin system